MMEFKHLEIGVSDHSQASADEEEEVIVAGAVSHDSKADTIATERRNVDRGSEESDSFPDESTTPANDGQVKSGSTTLNPSGEGDLKATEDERASSPSESSDAYHETTLDDIKESKMPKTQIAVIAVALVCLAAFIIWYIVTL